MHGGEHLDFDGLGEHDDIVGLGPSGLEANPGSDPGGSRQFGQDRTVERPAELDVEPERGAGHGKLVKGALTATDEGALLPHPGFGELQMSPGSANRAHHKPEGAGHRPDHLSSPADVEGRLIIGTGIVGTAEWRQFGPSVELIECHVDTSDHAGFPKPYSV